MGDFGETGEAGYHGETGIELPLSNPVLQPAGEAVISARPAADSIVH